MRMFKNLAFALLFGCLSVAAYAETTQQRALFNVIGPFTWTYALSDYLDNKLTFNTTATVKTTPLTGTTVTFAATQTYALIVPAGTIAALTVTLPACAAANDGDERRFSSSQIVTTLTVNAAAGTVVGASGAMAVGGGHGYHCVGADTIWYQMN